jgi:leucine dehydrogenase
MQAALNASDHEQIVIRRDLASGLRAIIAIHDTTLGPAAGGCRYWAYTNDAAALADALRLSRGMTFKNALADIPFGGGKSVILGVAGERPTARQLETFGAWVEELNGRYITAEDVGMQVADLRLVARRTRHVSGLGTAGMGGDPSPFTARGVLEGIRAAVAARLGAGDLRGVRVAVQGLGSVGMALCALLHAEGAELQVADLRAERVAQAVREHGARALGIDAILAADADVFAPCALGGVLTAATVHELQARVVAGAANNQLADDAVGDLLARRGVLYAPDYVINAGGVISVAREYLGERNAAWADERISGIAVRLATIFRRAAQRGVATSRIADEMALERLAAGSARLLGAA